MAASSAIIMMMFLISGALDPTFRGIGGFVLLLFVGSDLNQVDEKINQLNSLQSELEPARATDPSITTKIQELVQRGLNAREIAMKIGIPLDDVELTIAKL